MIRIAQIQSKTVTRVSLYLRNLMSGSCDSKNEYAGGLPGIAYGGWSASRHGQRDVLLNALSAGLDHVILH